MNVKNFEPPNDKTGQHKRLVANGPVFSLCSTTTQVAKTSICRIFLYLLGLGA
jgi:hypothetical protein